jgi:CheY-like chemotaxis protein
MATEAQPQGGTARSRCSVLVIEDDPDIREAIASVLEDDGYCVTAAADGAEGLAWLRSGDGSDACLVLLDLRMPVMDGAAFLKEMRALPGLEALRVCVLSADPAPTPPGADYVLQKPIGASSLLRIVDRLCSRAQAAAAAREPAGHPALASTR